MKKILVILMSLLLAGCSWGGRTYVNGVNLDNRTAVMPFRVYTRVVPGFDANGSVHYEFECWMLTGEKYTVLSDVVDGMRYVESGRCNGNAVIP